MPADPACLLGASGRPRWPQAQVVVQDGPKIAVAVAGVVVVVVVVFVVVAAVVVVDSLTSLVIVLKGWVIHFSAD